MPIILAIYPLIYGLPNAPLIFSVVFFVVLISATVQGSTLPWVAQKLDLTEPPPPIPAASLEITALNEVDAEIVAYPRAPHSRAAGRRLSQAALPEGTVVAMITRGKNVIPPRGSTQLRDGDHLFIVTKPETRSFIEQVFSTEGVSESLQEGEVLRLKGYTKVTDLQHSYGIDLGAVADISLDELLKQTLQTEVVVNASAQFGQVELQVVEMVNDRISTVGIVAINPEA